MIVSFGPLFLVLAVFLIDLLFQKLRLIWIGRTTLLLIFMALFLASLVPMFDSCTLVGHLESLRPPPPVPADDWTPWSVWGWFVWETPSQPQAPPFHLVSGMPVEWGCGYWADLVVAYALLGNLLFLRTDTLRYDGGYRRPTGLALGLCGLVAALQTVALFALTTLVAGMIGFLRGIALEDFVNFSFDLPAMFLSGLWVFPLFALPLMVKVSLRRLPDLAHAIDRLNESIGSTVAWLAVFMVIVQADVVLMRYVFGYGSIQMQEAITYAHGMLFMAGAAFTLLHDGHVRVDVFYRGRSARHRAWVDLFGAVVFLIPVSVLIFVNAWGYVLQSWAYAEGSKETSGLHGVYVLKSFILIFAVLMALQGLAMAIRSAGTLLTGSTAPAPYRQDPADHKPADHKEA